MSGYVLLRRAQADLRQIRDHILGDNPGRAVSFIEELLEVCQMLADHPDAGRRRDELRPGVRSFPHAGFVIFYRRAAANVQIIRVVHGGRDMRKLV